MDNKLTTHSKAFSFRFPGNQTEQKGTRKRKTPFFYKKKNKSRDPNCQFYALRKQKVGWQTPGSEGFMVGELQLTTSQAVVHFLSINFITTYTETLMFH